MSTYSSPGISFHERTRELCVQSPAPAKASGLSRGYWNSPAAQTTYRDRLVASSPAARTRTLKPPPSMGATDSTSVRSCTLSLAASAISLM